MSASNNIKFATLEQQGFILYDMINALQIKNNDYIDNIKQKLLQSPSKIYYYGSITGSTNEQHNRIASGRGGDFLKKTTIYQKITFIWYNQQVNMFEFWGDNENQVKKAMGVILNRINNAVNITNN